MQLTHPRDPQGGPRAAFPLEAVILFYLVGLRTSGSYRSNHYRNIDRSGSQKPRAIYGGLVLSGWGHKWTKGSWSCAELMWPKWMLNQPFKTNTKNNYRKAGAEFALNTSCMVWKMAQMFSGAGPSHESHYVDVKDTIFLESGIC